MADTIKGSADALADDVASAGKHAGAQAHRAASSFEDSVESASEKGASSIRSAGRRGSALYDEATEQVDSRVASLEESIRRNPLAAAGAALVVGLILGRFVL
ncbi:hypothetical protein [Hansschlegelia plantiphila]|uniref:DUF883 family protein n=1 Tax=Hansschlegelia plantiphila TaxID=374655 RepID=A0A9W6J4M5_9HYPH|nr:hypothetical protein [Hansschlegelia plantiphila]GLK69274.1 hypothetical protein GCM10008179_29120 [Hansschlegelia plantiphila]